MAKRKPKTVFEESLIAVQTLYKSSDYVTTPDDMAKIYSSILLFLGKCNEEITKKLSEVSHG